MTARSSGLVSRGKWKLRTTAARSLFCLAAAVASVATAAAYAVPRPAAWAGGWGHWSGGRPHAHAYPGAMNQPMLQSVHAAAWTNAPSSRPSPIHQPAAYLAHARQREACLEAQRGVIMAMGQLQANTAAQLASAAPPPAGPPSVGAYGQASPRRHSPCTLMPGQFPTATAVAQLRALARGEDVVTETAEGRCLAAAAANAAVAAVDSELNGQTDCEKEGRAGRGHRTWSGLPRNVVRTSKSHERYGVKVGGVRHAAPAFLCHPLCHHQSCHPACGGCVRTCGTHRLRVCSSFCHTRTQHH